MGDIPFWARCRQAMEGEEPVCPEKSEPVVNDASSSVVNDASSSVVYDTLSNDDERVSELEIQSNKDIPATPDFGEW